MMRDENGQPEVRSAQQRALSRTQGSLNELKRVYTSVLRERDEQILRLRSEISDLRTLVNVMESEIDRLKGNDGA